MSYEEQVIAAAVEDVLRRQHGIDVQLRWAGITIGRGSSPDGRPRLEISIFLTEYLTPQPNSVTPHA